MVRQLRHVVDGGEFDAAAAERAARRFGFGVPGRGLDQFKIGEPAAEREHDVGE